ncbi:MAG: AAA family ATPase [Alphaproteobacteria bacterium]|nr:AAA family ATPase [Alphaproteobacteria bacterium]
MNDRDEAWFFSGRGAEIDEIERLCTEALDRVRQGQAARGATRLFQGAPGAGKTALLTALQQRWDERARNARVHDPIGSPAGIPLAVLVHWNDLGSEDAVARTILKALDPALEETYRRTGTVGLDAGLRIPGVSVGGRASGSTAPPSLTFLELVRAVPPSAWTRPVCLMVDEVQAVDRSVVLSLLHQGIAGLPVVPLLAGLGSSQDHLAALNIGLSRLAIDAVHDIGALAPEEAQGAVRMMFERYRVDLEGVDHDWPSELASLSECWPQHLHNAMRALAEGLVAVGGRLAAVDTARVLDRDRHYRTISYSRRVSPAMDEARCLVGAVMAALPESGTDRAAIIDSLDRVAEARGAESVAWRLPRGMDNAMLFDHLVHQGALQRGTDKLYHCPIPSFRTYLIQNGGEPRC